MLVIMIVAFVVICVSIGCVCAAASNKLKSDEEKAKVDEELKPAQASLATAQQTIADKDAQIAELNENPGEEPAQGAAPQNNGEGAKAQNLREFDPSKYKTNAERKAAFERFTRGEE